MTKFHFRPFAPDLSKVLDGLEANLCCLLKDFASVVQVRLRCARHTPFLVEPREVDI